MALYPGGVPAGFFWVLPASLALLLVMLAVYILTVKETGRAAKVSVDLIGEEYFHSFFSAAVLLGTVLPLILGVYTVASPSAASFPVLFVIAALRIIGDVMTRNIILKVGVYDRVL